MFVFMKSWKTFNIMISKVILRQWILMFNLLHYLHKMNLH